MKYPVLFGLANTSKKTHEPFSVTASIISSTTLRVNWGNSLGLWTGVNIERSLNGGGWTALVTLPFPSVAYDDVIGPGNQAAYRISAYTNGGWTPSDWVVSNTASLIALVPVNVTLGVWDYNNLQLHYEYGGGNVTSYEIETYVAATGPWVAHSSSNNGTENWSTTVTGYMHVRALSPGGPSNWVQVGPVAPIPPDTTPPPAPEPGVDLGGGATSYQITWAAHHDTGSGNTSSYIQVFWDGVFYDQYDIGASGNAGNLFGGYLGIPGGHRGKTVTARLITNDYMGNQGVSTMGPGRQSKPYGLKTVNPENSVSWSATLGAFRGDNRVIANSDNIGSFFYGNRLTDVSKGFAADGATFHVRRYPLSGDGWVNLSVAAQGTPAGQPGPQIGAFNVATFAPGDNWNGFVGIDNIAAMLSQGTSRSVLVWDNTVSYIELYGVYEDYQSGQITLRFA